MGRQIDYGALAKQHGGVALSAGAASDLAPEDEYAALARQHGGTATELAPMALAVSHRRPADTPPQTIGRFAREATQSINPLNIIHGLSQLILHPIDTAVGVPTAHDRLRQQAQESFKRGDVVLGVRQSLEYALPYLTGAAGGMAGAVGGPPGAALGAAGGYALGTGVASRLDQAAEQLSSGDTAGGLGASIDAATMGALGALGARSPQRTLVTSPARGGGMAAMARRTIERMTPKNLSAAEASANTFARARSIPLDLATATGRQSIKNLQKAVGPYGPAEAFRASQEQNISRVGADLAAEAGPRSMTPVAAGERVREGLQSRVKNFHEMANDAYSRLREAEIAAPEEFVQARPIKPVASHITPEQSFPLRWLANDLEEFQFQPSSRMRGARANEEWQKASTAEEFNEAVYSPRVSGSPVQQMFHAMGIKGSRPEIAVKIEKYLSGQLKDPRFAKVADAMNEAWDGQRFDFDLVSDDTLTQIGIRRRDLKSPIGLPNFEEAGAAAFFPNEAIPTAPRAAAGGDTSMRLAVDLRGRKEALRPLYEELQREREITGNLAGSKGQAAVALKSLLDGPDFAPLSTVDAALGQIKALTRGASMPQLRSRAQGVASKVVGELDTAVRERAQAAGGNVAQALSAGRAATKAKYQTTAVMKRLTGKEQQFEPRRIFNALTVRNDGGVQALRALQRETPEALPDIARAYLEESLSRAEGAGGILEHSTALWNQWQKLGPESRSRLFPGEGQIKALNDYFLLVKKIGDNPNPSGTAGVMMANLSPRKVIPRSVLARILYAPDGPQRLARVQILLKSPSKPARAAALAELIRATQAAGLSPDAIPALSAESESETPSPFQARKQP